MPSSDQIKTVVQSYVDSFNNHDRDLFLGLFTESVVQIDPVGSEPNVGRAALAAFWDGVHSSVRKIEFDVHDLIISGDEACLVFGITQWRDDAMVTLRGVDVFEVDPAGHIASVKGYCDASHIDTKPL